MYIVPLLFPSSSKGCMLSSHWCRPSQALGPSTDGPKTCINQPFHFNSDFRFMNIEYRLFWAPVQGAWRHHRLSLSYRPPSVPWSTVDFPQDHHLAPCGELGEGQYRVFKDLVLCEEQGTIKFSRTLYFVKRTSGITTTIEEIHTSVTIAFKYESNSKESLTGQFWSLGRSGRKIERYLNHIF